MFEKDSKIFAGKNNLIDKVKGFGSKLFNIDYFKRKNFVFNSDCCDNVFSACCAPEVPRCCDHCPLYFNSALLESAFFLDDYSQGNNSQEFSFNYFEFLKGVQGCNIEVIEAFVTIKVYKRNVGLIYSDNSGWITNNWLSTVDFDDIDNNEYFVVFQFWYRAADGTGSEAMVSFVYESLPQPGGIVRTLFNCFGSIVFINNCSITLSPPTIVSFNLSATSIGFSLHENLPIEEYSFVAVDSSSSYDVTKNYDYLGFYYFRNNFTNLTTEYPLTDYLEGVEPLEFSRMSIVFKNCE